MHGRKLTGRWAALAKNSKKTQEAAAAAAERERLEFEALRKRLRAETEADMIVLGSLLAAEREARGIEQAAEDYAVGAEWRVSEAAREIDAEQRAANRDAVEKAAAEAAADADAKIAAVRADAEKRRAGITAGFEAARAGYADRVFGLVTGGADE